MNNDHYIALGDLLSDAATELNDDGMTALGSAVSIARSRLDVCILGLRTIAHRHIGDEPAATYARALLEELDREPCIEPIVDNDTHVQTIVKR